MASKKPEEPKTALPLAEMRKQAPDDPAGKDRYPVLSECLQPIWREGKCRRQSGSLRIRLVGGYYQITLSCPTEGLETSLVAETLVDLLDQLETRLNANGCVWTPDFAAQKKSRQVKIDAVE